MLKWENRLESSIFLFVFVFAVWIFELWMIPLALIVLLAKEASSKTMSGNWETNIEELFDMPNTEVKNNSIGNKIILIFCSGQRRRKRKN